MDFHEGYLAKDKALDPITVVQPTAQPYEAESFNVWKAPDAPMLTNANKHSTVFCPDASVLEKKDEEILLDIDSQGNATMQLVLPADNITFIKAGNRVSSFFDWSGQQPVNGPR